MTKIDLMVRQPLSDLPPEQLRPTPLLFVHGSWHGAWCWDERFLESFASQGYTACAFSLRYHGDNRHGDDPHGDNPNGEDGQGWRFTRFSHYLADLDQAVNELKLLNPDTPPVLIGHSLGGALVQKYLESHPAAGGVLLASVPPYGTAPAMLRFGSKYLFWLLLCIPTLDLYPVVKSTAVARNYLFSRLISYNEARKYHKLLKHESLVCYLQTVVLPFILRPRRLRRRKLPLLVLGGALDHVFWPLEFTLTARLLGADKAQDLPNAPHDLMLAPGWEEAAGEIVGWLKKNHL